MGHMTRRDTTDEMIDLLPGQIWRATTKLGLQLPFFVKFKKVGTDRILTVNCDENGKPIGSGKAFRAVLQACVDTSWDDAWLNVRLGTILDVGKVYWYPVTREKAMKRGIPKGTRWEFVK